MISAVHTVIRASVALEVIGHCGGSGGGEIICAEVNTTSKSCYNHSIFCSWDLLCWNMISAVHTVIRASITLRVPLLGGGGKSHVQKWTLWVRVLKTILYFVAGICCLGHHKVKSVLSTVVGEVVGTCMCRREITPSFDWRGYNVDRSWY